MKSLCYYLKITNIENLLKIVSSNIQIKDNSATNDERNAFDQHISNGTKTFDNIRKLSTGQGGDNLTVCLFDYSYFSKIISRLQQT